MAREYGILCRQDPVPDITWRRLLIYSNNEIVGWLLLLAVLARCVQTSVTLVCAFVGASFCWCLLTLVAKQRCQVLAGPQQFWRAVPVCATSIFVLQCRHKSIIVIGNVIHSACLPNVIRSIRPLYCRMSRGTYVFSAYRCIPYLNSGV